MGKIVQYEYEKTLDRYRDRAYKRNKAFKRIAIGTGIAFSLIFGWKTLKAEGIMDSASTDAAQVSTSISEAKEELVIRDNPFSSQAKDRSESKLAEKQTIFLPKSDAEVLTSSKQIAITGKCKLSKEDFEREVIAGEKLYSCLFDADENHVVSALLAISNNKYRRDYGLEKKIASRLVQIIEARDEYGFLHSHAIMVARNKGIYQVVPVIIKSFDYMSSIAKDEAVQTLGMFARKNDWNSINMLLRLVRDEDESVRAQAMASLLFVNKNVADSIRTQLRKENSETKCQVCRNAAYVFVELEDSMSEEQTLNFLSKVNQIKAGEKNKDFLKCLEFFDDEYEFMKLRFIK